jgi:hypothetical protein
MFERISFLSILLSFLDFFLSDEKETSASPLMSFDRYALGKIL